MTRWRVIRNYPRLDADLNLHYDRFEEVFHSRYRPLAALVYRFHTTFAHQKWLMSTLTPDDRPLEEIIQQLLAVYRHNLAEE